VSSFADQAAMRKLQEQIAELRARVEALETKRSPGRPPKEKEAA
jgi:polyhydroxyalkanoate synthesis regulator phasin